MEPRVISCDDCSMRWSDHCDDCVVTFVLRAGEPVESLELDRDEYRAVVLLARAGMVPDLRFRLAG